MKYMGSKARFAKDIIAVMRDDLDKASAYVEPFAGGFNMIAEIKHPARYAADANKYVIALFRALEAGWEPPVEVTREEYAKAKAGEYEDHLTGYIGFCCSYSGKYFGGYAGVVQTQGGERNYIAEARRNIMKQAAKLKGMFFCCDTYANLQIPNNSLIYCDPPYANTSGYATGDFNSEAFFEWCRYQSSKGHVVYISEYDAPFPEVWRKEAKSSLSANGSVGGNKVSIERLFKVP